MLEQCPTCYGRGYKPEPRKGGKPGFYARTCSRCRGSGQIDIPRYHLYWGPTGQRIAEYVTARTARAAIRKAPLPYRKYLGEIRAELIERAS